MDSMETVTLSSKGQLVIPKGVRDDAQLTAGSRLQVLYLDGEIRLRPLPDLSTSSLDSVAGCLFKPTRKPLSEAQTKTTIRATLKARNAP
jgi:AbrB family looped-hinge helix DNA binding protein